ncbi:MAG: HesB/IscA family protein [Candidatus Wenzhouxiangella sp. M2_3B_020]
MPDPSISLTEAAAGRVRSFLEREGGEGLRLGVRRTGCSGWAYVVELAEEIGPDDRVFTDHGIRIVVDGGALPFLAGTEVDFIQEGLSHHFEFHNPNVTDECGCGESFAVASSG